MKKEQLTELVVKVQKGDSQAANTLFSEIYNDVYYFAYKTVKNTALAEDITQESMIAILKNISTLKDPVAFPAWSRQVTYSQCTRYFRKTQDVLLAVNEDGSNAFDLLEEDNSEFLPDEALNKKDLRKTVASFIDALSPDHRATVILYYFDELPVSRIAEIQQITESAVKSRLYFARQAIKKKVEEYEKKTGTRLHAIPFIPFIGWIFSSEKATVKPSKAAFKVARKASLSAYSSAVGTTSAAGGLAGLSVMTKIVAGALATLLVAAPVTLLAVKAIRDREAQESYINENTDSDSSLSSTQNSSDTDTELVVKTVDDITYVRLNEAASAGAEYIMADGKNLFKGYTDHQAQPLYADSWLACPGPLGTQPREDVTSVTILDSVDGISVWKPVGDFSTVYPNLEELTIRCSSVGGVDEDNPFIGYKSTLKRLVLGQRVASIYDQFKDFSGLEDISIEEGGADFSLEGLFIPYFIGTAFYEKEENWEISGNSRYLICSETRICVEPYFRRQAQPSGLCEWEGESALFIPKSLANGKDKLMIASTEDSSWIRISISPHVNSYHIQHQKVRKTEFIGLASYCIWGLIKDLF